MDERIYEAAIRGDVQKLLHLLNEDANMQGDEPFLDRVMRDCIGKDNLLHLGALFGHVEFTREISSRKPEFARQLNSQGLSPLHLAAERGHVQVVKVLLETDANVCFVRDRDGRIPLHLAVIKGRVEVIEELVKAKNITAWLLTDEREPILHLCAKHDQFDALKKLVSLVTNDHDLVRLKDSNDDNILHILAAKLQTKIIEFLLDNTNIELEINALNVQKHTALDELYEAQWEAGYFLPNKNFLAEGAKRSSDLSSIGVGHPTYFKWWSTKPDSKWLEKMESSYMVLSVLIATVTYQAVFNPPGGIWQDDYPPPGSDKVKDDPRKHHKAGMPILSDKGPLQFEVFCISNSMGFVGSAAMILNMVIRRQVPPTCLTFLTLYSWICAYLSASFSIYRFALPPILLAVEYLLLSKVAKFVIERLRRQRRAEVTQQSVVIQTSTEHRNS